MENIFEIKFSFEQNVKDNVILKFSNKQGGAYNVFSYHWQCFVWAAVVGFIHNERRPLQSPIADRPFSLNTMCNGGGEKDAEALLCMCIAKAGSLDIMKEPTKAIDLINEYANGGFYYIMKMMQDQSITNDLEWVKQEIFTREIEQALTEPEAHDIDALINEVDSDAFEAAMQDIEEAVPKKEAPAPTKRRWSVKEVNDLKDFYAKGLSVEQIAKFFNRTEDDVNEQLNKVK